MSRSNSSISTKRFSSPVVTRFEADFIRLPDHREQPVHARARLRPKRMRSGAYSRNFSSSRICFDELALVLILRRVPFIHAQDHRAAFFMRVAGDGGVQRQHSFARIHHQQRDIRHAQMCRRAITTLSFSAISLVLPLRRMPAVSTNTYSMPSCDHAFIHGIARGSGDRRNNGALRSRPAHSAGSICRRSAGR